MQLRRGTEHVSGIAAESHDGRRSASGQYHGQQTDGECSAIRDVFIDGQSDRGGGHGCGAGRVDAHALRSSFARAMGAGRTDRVDWWNAGA